MKPGKKKLTRKERLSLQKELDEIIELMTHMKEDPNIEDARIRISELEQTLREKKHDEDILRDELNDLLSLMTDSDKEGDEYTKYMKQYKEVNDLLDSKIQSEISLQKEIRELREQSENTGKKSKAYSLYLERYQTIEKILNDRMSSKTSSFKNIAVAVLVAVGIGGGLYLDFNGGIIDKSNLAKAAKKMISFLRV